MRGAVVCRRCGRAARLCRCRGERTFRVKVYLGVDPNTGRERQKWIGGFASVREAEAHLLEIARSPAYGSGLGPRGSMRLRLADHLRDWLESCDVGEKERLSRKARMELRVIPHIGHVPLARVAPATVQRLLTAHLKGMNRTTAHKVYADLRQAFDHAVRLELITSNPCRNVQAPRPGQYRPTILTPEELARFLAECGRSGDKGLLFTAAYITGARLGELLGLTWRNADLERDTLYIMQDLERPQGGGYRLGDVKSAHSRRPIRLPMSLTGELRALRKRQVAERLGRGLCPDGQSCRKRHCQYWHDGDFVFTQLNGKPLDGHNLTNRDLKRLCNRAKVPPLRTHDLRHLHNTVLMREGVSPKIVKERAGHYSAAFTLDRYSWATPDMQAVAVEALERTLPRKEAK